MARRATRLKPATKDEGINSTEVQTEGQNSLYKSQDLCAPRLFVLAKGISAQIRQFQWPHPVTGSLAPCIYCSKKGIFELTAVSASKGTCKSWLLAPEWDQDTLGEEQRAINGAANGHQAKKESSRTRSDLSGNSGYVIRDPETMMATPLDPLFVILPALAPSRDAKQEKKQMFLSAEDHLDRLAETSEHMRDFLKDPTARSLLQRRMRAICDTVNAGDEIVYRLSIMRLMKELVRKARAMITNGLPPSMESHFVKKVLEIPVSNLKREDSTISVAETERDTEVPESQETLEGTASTVSQQPQSPDNIDRELESIKDVAKIERRGLTADDEVVELLRLRTALDLICQTYIPPHLHSSFITLIGSSETVDFAPLETHLEKIARIKAQAVALRALSDNISRKRAGMDDDEAAEARAEKKRRKEEEEKRTKSESQGVKALRKVDTSGMKKLSTFSEEASGEATMNRERRLCSCINASRTRSRQSSHLQVRLNIYRLGGAQEV